MPYLLCVFYHVLLIIGSTLGGKENVMCAPEFNKMNVYRVRSYSSRTLTLIHFRANKPSSNTPLFPCTEGLVLNWLYPRPLSPSAPRWSSPAPHPSLFGKVTQPNWEHKVPCFLITTAQRAQYKNSVKGRRAPGCKLILFRVLDSITNINRHNEPWLRWP